jgi:hypothetical protein
MELRLLGAEMRRALHRRVVWVLLGLALIGIVLLGLIAFFDSSGKSVAELHEVGTHPAYMADWWDGSGDGILMIFALPLLLGGLIGGASVVGAEWRAGTVTTLLTWEPRRHRLNRARMGSSFVLATGIGFGLQVLSLLAMLPAVLAHGSTAGVDDAFWLSLVAAMARLAALTGVAAVLGGSLATLSRSTTFALGAVFSWMVIVENLLRVHKPAWQPLLLGENLTIAATWRPIETVDFTRSGAVALATVVAYAAVLAVAAATSFARRDVASAA